MVAQIGPANLLLAVLALLLALIVVTAVVNPVYTVIAGVVLSFAFLVLMVVITLRQ